MVKSMYFADYSFEVQNVKKKKTGLQNKPGIWKQLNY
jgi:hypothetical protein